MVTVFFLFFYAVQCCNKEHLKIERKYHLMSGFRFCVTKVNENAIRCGIHFENYECTLCGRFVLGTFVVTVFVCLLNFFHKFIGTVWPN